MSSLAAARADNFYYPPEWDPKKGSLNKFQGQHPLRERARKIDQGILIIRFEMPFNVWCGGCKSMIAKGVRFNAEKKQIGNYFSTRIWSFKMKSACCQHEIEIHTDPKNCDYIIVNGAEKKTIEYDADDAGTLLLPDQSERAKLDDPLFKLEHQNADRAKAKKSEEEFLALKRSVDSKHEDPYRQNRDLRNKLRAQKKRVANEEAEARKLGLGIRLLPGTDEDRKTAALVSFRPKFHENLRNSRAQIQASSIFSQPSSSSRTRLNDSHNKQLVVKKRRMDVSGAIKVVTSGLAASMKAFEERKGRKSKRT